jgi:hypothetical protein
MPFEYSGDRQNRYLHLLFEWFAVETGYTAEEVKQDIFKKIVNTSLFCDGEAEGKLKGVKIKRWRSTASLSISEMTLAIERFRNYASIEAGIYLPEPNNLVMITELEREISKHKNQEFV